MKKRLLYTLAAILVLTACTPQQTDHSAPTATNESTAVQVDPSTVESADSTLSAAGRYDYSHHDDPDEDMYTTSLVDLSALPAGQPLYAVTETPARWTREFQGLEQADIWGYDFRSMDVSSEDLTEVAGDYISFNSDTIWPEELPAGFDPEHILEYNKDPGLGIRAIHEQGIDGSGVGVAVIDQGLLLEHQEYSERLMLYERIHCIDESAAMHGPAVASLAVGNTIGTAPGAKLYYIASTFGHFTEDDYLFDASIIADCVYRVLEINENLPEGERIRVISISRGYMQGNEGYDALQAAIAEADKAGVFVITTSPGEYYTDFNFLGMNRDYGSDPNVPANYLPAGWLADSFYADPTPFENMLLVPMGSRTYAGSHGIDRYEIGREGGMSWAVPGMAGFYTMCCQAKPDITPQEFIDVLNRTAVATDIEKDGETYRLGKVVDPAAVLTTLTNR